jgi:hypothetical protein
MTTPEAEVPQTALPPLIYPWKKQELETFPDHWETLRLSSQIDWSQIPNQQLRTFSKNQQASFRLKFVALQ